jgi:hypothetical protein
MLVRTSLTVMRTLRQANSPPGRERLCVSVALALAKNALVDFLAVHFRFLRRGYADARDEYDLHSLKFVEI